MGTYCAKYVQTHFYSTFCYFFNLCKQKEFVYTLKLFNRVHQVFIIFQERYGAVIFLFSGQKYDDMKILGVIGHP